MARDRTVNFVMTAVDRTRQGVQSVQRRFRGLSREVADSAGGITRFATAGITAAIGAITTVATAAVFRLLQVNQVARDTKLSPVFVRQLERLGAALDLPTRGLEAIFRTIQNAGRNADGTLSDVAESLDEIGINIDQFGRSTSVQRLAIIVEAFRDIADEGERARTATALFGREGAQALRGLLDLDPRELREALVTTREEISKAQEAAITFVDEGRKRFRQLNDQILDIAANGFGTFTTSVIELTRIIKESGDGAERIADQVDRANDLTLEQIEKNKQLRREQEGIADAQDRAIGQSETALNKFFDAAVRARNAFDAALVTAGNNARQAADEAEDALGRVASRLRNALNELRRARSGQIQEDERFNVRAIQDPREQQLQGFLDRFGEFQDRRALEELRAAQQERERTQQIFDSLRNLRLTVDPARLSNTELKTQTKRLERIIEILEGGSAATFS